MTRIPIAYKSLIPGAFDFGKSLTRLEHVDIHTAGISRNAARYRHLTTNQNIRLFHILEDTCSEGDTGA